jgi:cellulose synthase operon protein C
MRMVLKNEPNFAPGWERIARWYRTLEMEAEYLEAAYNLARLMPQYFVAYGYLGEAKLWHGDREGAKESLQRALTLAPDYDFAGLTLFDLQLEDHDLRAAGKTLARLEQFVGSDATTLRALKLALSADNPGQVQKHFLALCQSPVHLTTYLDQAIELLAPTHLDKIIDAVSEDLLATPGVHPHVGTLWARRNAAQPEYCLQRLHQLADQPISKLWHNAAATFLTICANQGAAEPAHNFIHDYEDALRAEAESWGTVGATLYRLGDAQAAVEWLSDWRKREGVTPGTLWHLALALRDLKREEEAKEVCLSAIKLPEDQCTNSHLALLSLDEALGGHLEDAHKHAARITPHTLNEWDQVMLELATSLREVHTARTEGRSIAQAVIDRLLQRIQQTPELHQSRSFIPLFQRVIENVLTIENDALLKIKTKLKLKWLAYRTQS